MALAERATLLVSLDLVDKLSPGLSQADAALLRSAGNVSTVEKQVANAGAGITKSFTSIGSAIKLGVAGFAAFQAVDVLKGAVSAAIEEETSIAKLSSSLKANVTAWDGNTEAIERTLAARMQLGFSDDEQRESLARLVAATHDVNDALELERAAMDLAAFKGISLGEASEALIRIEGGQFRALKGLIGATDDIKTSEEALAAVHKATAGAAEDLANTTAGKLTAANIALNEATEKLGGIALPALTLALNAVAGAANDAGEFIERFRGPAGDLIDTAQKLNTSAKEASGGIDLLGIATTNIGGILNFGADAFENMMKNIRLLNGSTEEQTVSTEALSGGLSFLGGIVNTVVTAVSDHAAETARATAETTELGVSTEAAAHIMGESLSPSIKGVADDAADATHGVDLFQDALDALPNSVTVTLRLKTIAEGAGGRNVAEKGATAADIASGVDTSGDAAQQRADFLADNKRRQDQIDADRQRDRDEAKRKRDADARAAAAQAKRDAAELASINREKVGNSYDVAKRASDRLFDSLHDRHVKAIKDAEALAEKQHDAAVQNINDTLTAQKVANAAPVTAAEKAQSDTEASRQRRNLIESVQAAQQALATNRDQTRALDLQRSLRDATESLQSFDANRAIDRLKGAQAIQDQAAENAAKIARDKADADLEAAKTKAAADEKFVNTRDAKRKQDFDTALAALKKRDEQDPAKFLTDLKQLQTKFGIFTDERGFTHIGDVVADAITKTKPPPVNVTLTVPRGAIQLNGRDVNNAVTVGISPTQSQSARSGNARPRT